MPAACDKPWPLWPLPLVIAALLLLASHCSLLLGAAAGNLGWCFPYGADCHSVSATGRAMPARLLFKPLLTCAATLLILYWMLMSRWLYRTGCSRARSGWVAGLGALGVLCLVPYAAALGEGGDSALLLRRLGAVLGFSLSFLAQLLMTDALPKAAPTSLLQAVGLVRGLWGIVLVSLALGLASAMLAPIRWHERIDDGIEWWLALLLNLHVALTALLWRRSGFRL